LVGIAVGAQIILLFYYYFILFKYFFTWGFGLCGGAKGFKGRGVGWRGQTRIIVFFVHNCIFWA
jgi:hypothetical protein